MSDVTVEAKVAFVTQVGDGGVVSAAQGQKVSLSEENARRLADAGLVYPPGEESEKPDRTARAVMGSSVDVVRDPDEGQDPAVDESDAHGVPYRFSDLPENARTQAGVRRDPKDVDQDPPLDEQDPSRKAPDLSTGGLPEEDLPEIAKVPKVAKRPRRKPGDPNVDNDPIRTGSRGSGVGGVPDTDPRPDSPEELPDEAVVPTGVVRDLDQDPAVEDQVQGYTDDPSHSGAAESVSPVKGRPEKTRKGQPE